MSADGITRKKKKYRKKLPLKKVKIEGGEEEEGAGLEEMEGERVLERNDDENDEEYSVRVHEDEKEREREREDRKKIKMARLTKKRMRETGEEEEEDGDEVSSAVLEQTNVPSIPTKLPHTPYFSIFFSFSLPTVFSSSLLRPSICPVQTNLPRGRQGGGSTPDP